MNDRLLKHSVYNLRLSIFILATMKTPREHLQRLGKSLRKRYTRTRRKAASAIYGRMRPTATIIGVEKGGTTALFKYLSLHPSVVPSLLKELQFFNSDRDYLQGEKFYLQYFEANTPANKSKITLDATPEYLWAAKKTAKRINDFNPDFRLIASLRDPVTRAYSAWQMYKKFYLKDKNWYFKWITRGSVEDPRNIYVARKEFGKSFYSDIQYELAALKAGQIPEMPILEFGHYADQLDIFYQIFNKEQLLIIDNDELKKNTKATLAVIEDHLGIDHHHWKDSDIAPYFEGGYSEKMTEQEMDLLKAYYRPHNERLFKLLDRRFDWM